MKLKKAKKTFGVWEIWADLGYILFSCCYLRLRIYIYIYYVTLGLSFFYHYIEILSFFVSAFFPVLYLIIDGWRCYCFKTDLADS